MKITTTPQDNNTIKLVISADATDLTAMKTHVLEKMASSVKIAGFREGKAPLNLVEKQLDANRLQAEVIDEAINHFYSDAIAKEAIRVVSQPKVDILKFVPFTELEFSAVVDVLPTITLPNYKKKQPASKVDEVTAKDVTDVLERLQLQGATYEEVERSAKNGDRVTIDFEGSDDKGKLVSGATGKDYPLALGSNTFIPGFEDNVVGLKKDEEKTFTIPFPKDYSVKALQGKKVTFKITAKKIEETKKAVIDDAFAATVGPFKNVAELKADIKKQLKEEKDRQAKVEFENTLIKDLVKQTTFEVPKSLLEEQIELVDREFKQNLAYRGETFTEYLANAKLTEESYREKELKPAAEERLKAGLILSEIAAVENLTITSEELEIRMQIMKGQYTDPQMQAELEKPEARRDVASRMLTEKTVATLVKYAQ
jgi:trigger factor